MASFLEARGLSSRGAAWFLAALPIVRILDAVLDGPCRPAPLTGSRVAARRGRRGGLVRAAHGGALDGGRRGRDRALHGVPLVGSDCSPTRSSSRGRSARGRPSDASARGAASAISWPRSARALSWITRDPRPPCGSRSRCSSAQPSRPSRSLRRLREKARPSGPRSVAWRAMSEAGGARSSRACSYRWGRRRTTSSFRRGSRGARAGRGRARRSRSAWRARSR